MPDDSDPREEADRLTGATQVRLTTAQLRGLSLLADQRGTTTSAVLRSAVVELLEKYEDEDGLTLHERLRREVEQEAQAMADFTYALARQRPGVPVRRKDEDRPAGEA